MRRIISPLLVGLLLLQNVKARNPPLSDSTVRDLINKNLIYINLASPRTEDYGSTIRLLDSFDSISDPAFKSEAAYVLGHYYMHAFDMKNALRYFAMAAKMYERTNQWGKYLNVMKDFCNASRSAGDYAVIEPTLRKCLEISKKHHVGFYVLDPLHELTIDLSYTQKNYPEAIKYGQMFMDTLEKYERLHIVHKDFAYSKTFDRAIAELELGHSYLELGQFEKASMYLHRAKHFFKPRQEHEKLIRVYRHLAVLADHWNQADSVKYFVTEMDYHRVADGRAETTILFGVPRLTRRLQVIQEAYLQNKKDVDRLEKWNYYIIILSVLVTTIVAFVLWTQRESKEDRSRITDLLKKDFVRSAQLNEQKTKYFSILSHELRTPIFAITGLAKLLEDPTGNTQDNIDAIINSGNHLLHLVNNILQHNKLEESGHVVLEEVDFNLQETVKEALQTTSYLAGQKNINLVPYIHNEPQHLKGDKQKLVQILVNLISNAIRYSHRDGRVEISVTKIISSDSGGEFLFSIRDHGIGIESAQIPFLFDYRKTTHEIQKMEDDNLKGMGIGLFVVANFISAMGGKIDLESQPGQGSNFYFDLVFKSGQPVKVLKNPLQRSSKDVKIMVVDDIRINLIVTQKTLSTIGVTCISATDADPVVEMILRENIDLVLMDLNMPLINGYDLSKKIRQAGISIPIIAHTAVIQENIDYGALEDAEIHDFLIKPYPIEDLKEKLTKYLNISFLTQV